MLKEERKCVIINCLYCHTRLLFMKISIITVVYNGEKTIEKTLKSVIREKCSDGETEYIVIDGKSTDNTMSIIEKYREFIDVCVSEKDFGIDDALNKGISKATGDYYILVAADDEMLPGAIKMFRSSIKEATDVWCGAIICLVDGFYRYVYSSENLSDLYNGCSLRHPATFFRKTIVDRVGRYDTSFKIVGDRDLFLRLYLIGAKFQVENIPIVLFDKNGISNTDKETRRKEERRITMKYALQEYKTDLKPANMYISKVKKCIRRVLVYTHTYRFVCALLGKSNEFVSRDDMKKYGL